MKKIPLEKKLYKAKEIHNNKYDYSLVKDVDCRLKVEIKNKYCIDNNIKLIRISYINIKNIDKILNKNLNYDK